MGGVGEVGGKKQLLFPMVEVWGGGGMCVRGWGVMDTNGWCITFSRSLKCTTQNFQGNLRKTHFTP